MLAKSKLNSIETLVSPVLIDLEISHEGFKTIVNEKKGMTKENIRNTKISYKKDELSANNKNIRENDM